MTAMKNSEIRHGAYSVSVSDRWGDVTARRPVSDSVGDRVVRDIPTNI